MQNALILFHKSAASQKNKKHRSDTLLTTFKMNVDSKPKEVTPPPSTTSSGGDSASNVPSGFILKLFQMVNGAPDEVISVSSGL